MRALSVHVWAAARGLTQSNRAAEQQRRWDGFRVRVLRVLRGSMVGRIRRKTGIVFGHCVGPSQRTQRDTEPLGVVKQKSLCGLPVSVRSVGALRRLHTRPVSVAARGVMQESVGKGEPEPDAGGLAADEPDGSSASSEDARFACSRFLRMPPRPTAWAHLRFATNDDDDAYEVPGKLNT